MADTVDRDLLESLNRLEPRDFERLIADLAREVFPNAVVEAEVKLGSFQTDLVVRNLGSGINQEQLIVFEAKRLPLISQDLVAAQVGRREILRSIYPGLEFVLAVSGQLTEKAEAFARLSNLTVWNGPTILSKLTPALRAKWFGLAARPALPTAEPRKSKAATLIAALQSIPSGEAHALHYQKWVADAFEFLFVPPLGPIHYEDSDRDRRNRRDLILENWAPDGFWSQMRTAHRADQVVVDAKNYSGSLKKRPVIDLAHYLKPYGCGMFGILCCRRDSGPSADHAIREQWIGAGKLILALSDTLLIEMLRFKESGTPPEEVIRRQVANFRKSL